ncbi:MazG family protein [Saccharopolyspora phatthalungensis]|uniref:XTP/dITP diphosphohydrolase n=1 Tax=Saccharopolyspora phatthalungensis TaxID=664693 RepID=A0A840Q0U1_9PSEU|nr:MazG family protein [Saccharopolyspora phatthalungensis]MBB5153590.1 XTP/dITP diphosphohydrolase [Saccharopolyspora phatthalungensis]
MSDEVRVAEGSAVVVVDDRLGEVLPAAALSLLRSAAVVYAEPGLAPATRAALDVPAPPAAADLLAQAVQEPVVLIVGELASAAADGLCAAGARLVTAPAPAGIELLDAVTVMDRLRSPGGCPWDAEQDHDTLRQYLVEETYELLDAIEHRDREALCEELGDVLLQVLFHARVATEDPADPFGIDAVAAGLVSKLVSRHPHVFADGPAVLDAESQHTRWEELKQQEKQRESIVDGVALGQPAVALAAKLVQRANRAGIPADAMPRGETPGDVLFGAAAQAKLTGHDPEDQLRSVALAFAERIRSAERLARESGRKPAELSAADWRELMSGLPGPAGARSET